MGYVDPTSAIYQDPDQDSVRSDLTTLFGPRSDYYLKEYEDRRQRKEAGELHLRPSWNWWVFFGGFAWFFYRKLYVYGAALFILPIALNWLLGDFPDFGMGIIVCAGANMAYVDWSLRRVAKANALSLLGEARADYLRRAGGVSKWAGAIAGVIAMMINMVGLWDLAQRVSRP